MLIIREQQLKAFEAAKKKELPDRIVKFLQEKSPSSCATLGQAPLRSLVDTALAAAAEFNLDIDWDLYRFCWLDLLYGPGFYASQPWATSIIAEPSENPTAMMDRLEQYHLDYPPRESSETPESTPPKDILDFSV